MPHTMTHRSLYSLTLAELDAMLDDDLLEVTALLLRSARPAYWRRDGDLAGHVYFADSASTWYKLDLDASRALLRAHLAARLHTWWVHDDDDELREARDYVDGERVGWDRLLCRADELVRRVDVLDIPRGPYERGVWRGWEASRRALLRALGRMRSVTPDGYVERAVGATRATESLDPLPPPENEENEESERSREICARALLAAIVAAEGGADDDP